MENFWTTKTIHHITEANINYYATPFVHPKRKMKEHDFIYLISGEWKIGQNNKIYELKKDSLLILSANNLHYGVTPCQEKTKTMYFHVRFNKQDEIKENDSENIVLDTLINASNNKKIKKLFSEIVNCKISGNQRKADLYFELLLCELNDSNLNNKDAETAIKIQNIINSNPERFFSNQELAKKVNVCVKTAETKFKTMFGKTIHQYILDYKIKEAISYFDIFPEITIKEVAHNLGFYDEYHFSKQFKKIVGISPLKYKNEYKK